MPVKPEPQPRDIRQRLYIVLKAPHILRRWFDDVVLRRLFRNAGLLLSGKIMTAVMGLGSVAVAARALGADGFGMLILIHAFAQAIGELVKFQSWQALLRYGAVALLNDRRGDLMGLLGFSVRLDLASAICGIGLAVLAVPLATAYLEWPREIASAAALYSGTVLFMATGTPIGILRLFDRFDLMAIQGFVPATVRLLGGAVMFASGGGLESFLAVWALAVTLGGTSLMVMAWGELRRRGLLEDLWRHITRGLTARPPDLWRFVWFTNANAGLALVTNQLPTLVIGWMLGPAAAGLYRVARQFGEAIGKPSRFLVSAIFPELAKLSALGASKALGRTARRSALVAGGGAVIVVLLLALIGEPLLRYTVGNEFLSAYPLMLLLAISAVVMIAAFPLEPLMISVGRAGIALGARATAAAIYAPLLLLMLGWWDVIGAGIAALIQSILILLALAIAAAHWQSPDDCDQRRLPSIVPLPRRRSSSPQDGEHEQEQDAALEENRRKLAVHAESPRSPAAGGTPNGRKANAVDIRPIQGA